MELPAATEDYRTFVELLNTMYTEGLISKDHFTMDTATARGLGVAGICGAFADGNLMTLAPETFTDWTIAQPVTAGDNDKVMASVNSPNQINKVWVSASTEHPEIVAKMVDYVYDVDNYSTFVTGPKAGEDPFGMLDGWYIGEDGTITTKLVADGTYGNYDYYGQNFIYPNLYVGNNLGAAGNVRNPDGSVPEAKYEYYPDALTGEQVEMRVYNAYTKDNVDGYFRFNHTESWADKGYVTTVRLPAVFMSEEDAIRADELMQLINDHITTETVNFVTGVRPLSEIDKYFEELKSLNVDEYIELYRNAYSVYIDAIFN